MSGWLGTGPTGVILTTMSNAFEVAEKILRDIQTDKLLDEDKNGSNECKKLLNSNNVQLVDWEGWKRIDKFEQEEGKRKGKPREKIVDIKKMLAIASP